ERPPAGSDDPENRPRRIPAVVGPNAVEDGGDQPDQGPEHQHSVGPADGRDPDVAVRCCAHSSTEYINTHDVAQEARASAERVIFLAFLEPARGLEPRTCRLRISCSTN